MSLSSVIQKFTNLLLFLLPWQTIWIYKEPFINGLKWQYGTMGFYATEMLAWLTVILFLFYIIGRLKRKDYHHEKKLTKDRLFAASGFLFFAYVFVISFFAPFPDVAHQYILRVMLAFILFIVLSAAVIDLRQLLFWFIAGSIPASMLGIWQFLSQTTIASSLFGLASHQAADAGTSIIVVEGERWLRAYGSMAHPNIFGGYLFFVLLACLSYWLYTYSRTQPSGFSRIKESITLAAALLASSALFFSFSRSAWIAAGLLYIGTAFFFVKQRMGIRVHLVIVVPFIVLSILFSSLVAVRLGVASRHEQQSIDERVSGAVEAKDIIRDHLWLGVGAGNYTAALYKMDRSRPGWEYQPVHSVPVLFIAEVGVLGSILFIMWLASFVLLYRQTLWRSRYWVGCLFVGSLPLYLFDHYLFSSFIGIALCPFLATLVVRPAFSPS